MTIVFNVTWHALRKDKDGDFLFENAQMAKLYYSRQKITVTDLSVEKSTLVKVNAKRETVPFVKEKRQ